MGGGVSKKKQQAAEHTGERTPHSDLPEDSGEKPSARSEAAKSAAKNKDDKGPAKPSFRVFWDKYETLAEVQAALRRNGLESSNLIIGIDYTKSNTWTGKETFGGQCLHAVVPGRLNPYQTVVSILGRTLEAFDDDNLIPAFGFGDIETGDHSAFPFYPDRRLCVGFEEVLKRYESITPGVCLSGPTNFAPLIREAIEIVRTTRKYHILVIVADGQVTKRADTEQAIIEAASYPLSIITVGVGDGPWDTMHDFDDGLPSRQFDNFQFVEFHQTMISNPKFPEAGFALAALQEIPEQFLVLQELDLI